MKYRKLRIAWSAGWGVACLLLVTLWVRSYWWHDIASYGFNPRQAIRIDSIGGGVQFLYMDWRRNSYSDLRPGLNAVSLSQPEIRFLPISDRDDAFVGFLLQRLTDGIDCAIPYWFLLLLSLLFSVTSWLPLERFSLRALLIAMTLVAVGLGLVVYALRN